MRNSHENKHKPYLHLGPPILKPKFDLPGSQSQLSAQLQPLLLIWVRTLLEHPSLPILYFKLFAKPTNKQIKKFQLSSILPFKSLNLMGSVAMVPLLPPGVRAIGVPTWATGTTAASAWAVLHLRSSLGKEEKITTTGRDGHHPRPIQK